MNQDPSIRETVDKPDNAPYSIAVDENDFVVRLNRQFFPKEAISRFLDFLSIEFVRKRSQASQDEIDQLAKEIKQKAWARIKPQFVVEQ